jgi:hypothetical protein
MTANPQVKLKITIAWWWAWLYVPGLQTMSMLGFIPEPSRVAKVALKAITIHIVAEPAAVLRA